MYRGVNTISPPFQVIDVEINLIDFPVDVLQASVGSPGRPTSARNKAVQFWEISFRNRFAPVQKTLNSCHAIGKTFKIVPSHDLLMHVVEKFPTTILSDDTIRTFERINQVPMPVVEVDPQVFPEVRQAMFRFQIRSSVISRNDNGVLKKDVEKYVRSSCVYSLLLIRCPLTLFPL